MFLVVVHKSKRVDTSMTGENSWMLDVGPLRCWKLDRCAVGCWKLEVGCWRLEVREVVACRIGDAKK